MGIAMESMVGTPFQQAAQSAMRKLVAAMQDSDASAARSLAARVHLLGSGEGRPAVPSVIADALSGGRVLRIGYRDRDGTISSRDVEPLGYVAKPTHWYLVGWCRLRDGIRAFRTDRIV